MKEFEPKLKKKVFTREFFSKYIYVFVIGLCLLLGVSYSLTFFVQNYTISTGSITIEGMNITFTDRNINATGLTVPTTNQEGLSIYSKSLTITNTTNVDGKVKLTLTRTSGLNLNDLSYAIIINGAIQEMGDVPSTGEILSTAIMGGSPTGETLNVELRLWPKITYAGSATTFVGELTPEIRYLGKTAASITSPAGKYVNFNCNGNTCEKWQIVKVENGRLVLTTQANYSGATSRVNSNKYLPASFNPALSFNDDSLITSLSTDGKNVYLTRTAKISGGTGTIDDPYDLTNDLDSEPDRKVQSVITYKDGQTTLGTQNVYYGETNYISQVYNKLGFRYWLDNTDQYTLGDTINFSTDKNLTAFVEIWASEVSFDNTVTGFNCGDTQCALTQLSALTPPPICKRATTRHTEVCTSTSATTYCQGDGYALNANITYGNLGTAGSLPATGDAFDCDVNGNGIIDVDISGNSTERFYYVSPYYNTSTQSFDPSTAVLIYYSNTINGAPSLEGAEYDSTDNWHGPRSALANLPTTTQWSNIELKNTSRNIIACNNADCTIQSAATSGGTITNPFSYAGRAARLLTIQEIKRAGCDTTSGKTSLVTNMSLSACNFLLEGTKYADTARSTWGPWLENPSSGGTVTSWWITSSTIRVYDSSNYPVTDVRFGIRPVIDVPISRIEY